MPITGRTPNECFRTFRDHIARLVAATLTASHPVHAARVGHEHRRALGFWQGDKPIAVPLETTHGRLYFAFSYLVGVVQEENRYRLTTLGYSYRLQPDATGRALLRWEYDPGLGDRPQHHVQANAALRASRIAGELDLDRLHAPTGRVLLEDVIRFLITELRVSPPCGENQWRDILDRSVRRYRTEFRGSEY